MRIHARDMHMVGDAVSAGVLPRGLGGYLAYVARGDRGGAQERGGNAQDTGACPLIDYARAGPQMALQRGQTHTCGLMDAGAEGHPRIDLHLYHARLRRHGTPAWPD